MTIEYLSQQQNEIYTKSTVDIFNRNNVLLFVKENPRVFINRRLFKEIINKYINDIEILSHIDIDNILKYYKLINSNILYNYLINTQRPILYSWDKIKNLDCIQQFTIDMIYNIVVNMNKYIILFDDKYYDCKILNLYALYHVRKQCEYFKLYLIRNVMYDTSFIFDNVVKFLIKYI